MVKQLDLSIIGLGKLGAYALSSLCFKSAFNVIGYDKNQNVSESIKSCVNIYKEPQLTNYLRKYKNIDIVFNLEDILTKSKVSIIILPTPSKKDGSFSLDYIKKLFDELKTFRDIIKKLIIILF